MFGVDMAGAILPTCSFSLNVYKVCGRLACDRPECIVQKTQSRGLVPGIKFVIF